MFKWLANIFVKGWVEATKFVTTGGNSTQFTKGDGSLDSTQYEPEFGKNTAFNKNFGTGSLEVARGNHNHSGTYVDLVSTQNNIGGFKTFTSKVTFANVMQAEKGVTFNADSIYFGNGFPSLPMIGMKDGNIGILSGRETSNQYAALLDTNKLTSNRLYFFPNKGGTIALEGDSPTNHTHEINEVNGLQAALNSKALKVTEVITGTGMSGGGNLSANVNIGLSNGTLTSLALADTALQSNDLNGYATESWTNSNFDKYTSWNLKTNGVQRTTVTSGGTLDLIAGSNVSLSYGAGGKVTVNATDTNTDTTYSAGAGITLSGTTFSQDITTSGAGTYIKAVSQTAGGLQFNLGTPPNTTYSLISTLEIGSNTNTAERLISGQRLNTWGEGKFEPKFTKNTAFNKNFGTTAGTIVEGNDGRVNNGQTAFSWGNHALEGYLTSVDLNGYATQSWSNGQFEPKFTKNTAFNKNFGTTTGTVSEGNHTHSWSQITDKPTTFPASSHSHSWAQITGKPTTFTPSAHTHGSITDDGKIGTSPNRVLVTSTGGLITHEAQNNAFNKSFGTSANTVAQGNDSRFHSHSNKTVIDGISSTDVTNWTEAFDGTVVGVTISGTENKILTITKEDGSTLTANFSDINHPNLPDDVLNTLTFNDTNGNLIAITSEGIEISANLDGRYSLLGHSHSWAQITGKPTTFTPSAHTHTLASLSDSTITSVVNGEILRWSGTKWINNTLTEAGIQPAGSYASSSHTHSWSQITSKPSTFPPSAHTHDLSELGDTTITSITNGEILKWDGTKWINNSLSEAGIQPAGSYASSSHTHSWAQITGKPTTFTPSAHTHDLSELGDTTITSVVNGEILRWSGTKWINNTLTEAGIQPAGSYASSSHTHSWAQITGKPTTFTPSAHTHEDLIPGVGLTGVTYNGGVERTISFDTAWGDVRYLGLNAQAVDSDKLDGQQGTYYLDYNNFSNTPTIPSLNGYATESWTNSNFDKYTSWNLKTNGVQRTTVTSGGTLDLIAGSNVSLSYGAGGKVTVNATDTNTDTTYSAGANISITGGSNVIGISGTIPYGNLPITSTQVSYWTDMTDLSPTSMSYNDQGLLRITRNAESTLNVDIDTIKVKDTRSDWSNTTGSSNYMPSPTDAQLDRSVTTTFTSDWGGSDTWGTVMNVKGWSGSYASWQLGGTANSTNGDKNLYYRTGAGTTWDSWKKVLLEGETGTNMPNLNSDTVDNLHGHQFLRADADDFATGKLVMGDTASNRDAGIYGNYTSAKIGHIWSMGTSFRVSNTGADFGNIYGLAYKYDNVYYAKGHQVIMCQAGVPTVAMGTDLWVKNDFYASGSSYSSDFVIWSDRSLKTEIKEYEAKPISIEYKSFKMKKDKSRSRIGVIAQELEKTHPEFVHTDKEGVKSVSYIDLMMAKIAELEAEIKKLKDGNTR